MPNEKSLQIAQEEWELANRCYKNYQYEKALLHYQKAQSFYQNISDEDALCQVELQIIKTYIGLEKNTIALEKAQTLLEKNIVRLGEEHLVVAAICIQLGTAYQNTHNVSSALNYFQKALHIQLKELGEYDSVVANTYYHIGYVYGDMGKYAQNIAYAEKALNIQLNILELEDKVTAKLLHNLGKAYALNGNLLKGLKFLEYSLQIQLKILNKLNSQTFATYQVLGQFYYRKGDNEKALTCMQKGFDIAVRLFGEKNTGTAKMYGDIGFMYLKKGDYDQALLFHQKALHIHKNILGEKHYYIGEEMLSMGNCYLKKKDYSQALQYIQQALYIFRKISVIKKYVIVDALRLLAQAYQHLGKPSKALESLHEALELARKHLGEQVLLVRYLYIGIGDFYITQKQYNEALEHYNTGLQINLKMYGEQHLESAHFYQLIAEAYQQKQSYTLALNHCQKALYSMSKGSKVLSPTDPIDWKSYTDDVGPYLLPALKTKAAAAYQYYLSENPTVENLLLAVNSYEACFQLIVRMTQSYQTDSSKLFWQDHMAEICSGALLVVTQLWEQNGKEKYQTQSFRIIEKAKASLLLSSLQENIAKIATQIPSSLLAQEKQLKIELTFLNKNIQQKTSKLAQDNQEVDEKDKQLLQEWKSQFFDLHQAYLQLIQQFEQDYPDYYQLKYNTQTVSIESLQQNLTDNQVMVNYFIGESHYYLFLISSNGFEVHDFEKPEDFEALVEGFLEAVHEHQLEEYAAKAYELYQHLLQPVEHHLMDSFAMFGDLEEAENEDTLEEAKPKELIIIPHGILSYLPFEALLCSALEDSMEGELGSLSRKLGKGENAYHHLDYLLLHCEVSYHYSATLWHYLSNVRRKRAEAEHDFVGFAPVYESTLVANEREIGEQSEKGEDNTALRLAAKEVGQWATRSEALRSDGTWTPLPHSKVEAEQIAHLFEQKGLKTQTFLHEQATKEQFQEVVENSRFLLIAAHGVVNDAQPKLSGLVFYPEMREKRIETRDEREVENSPSFVKRGDIWNDTRKMSPNLTGVGESSQTDCILSMEETYHLDLKADLVVLSSCESGIGELAKGEGMMAVNRGFLYAGAKNVVSTLFKVYDRPSSLLTQYLFEGVLEGKGYTAALREAKLRLLKQEEVDVKSWSGFVLIGGKS